MNALFNILERFISAIDRLIAGIDRRTQETIKQAAYLLAFAIIAASVGIGIYKGKEAARIGAVPSFSSINEIFETDVKQSRKTPFSRIMVESGQINEITDPELRRILFPTQTGQEPTVGETVVEPEAPHKIQTPSGSDRLAEIDRTDESLQKADVKPLIKREASPLPQTILPDRDEGVLPRKSGTDVRSDTEEGNAVTQESKKPLPIKSKKSLKPLDRETNLIEK
ncbi:MAG: hypothetical protein N2316_11270 [Spirochaetes bacterium]|nr:hypothetical protein [Spirochaetota bacterium]